jgi:hypothetical protein
MNERLLSMRDRVLDGSHHSLRQAMPIEVVQECEADHLTWPRRVARLVRRQCEAERIVIEPDEQIVFTRTLPSIPAIYSESEWEELTKGRVLHELGPVSNICADWSLLLSQGLLGRKQIAIATS